MALPIVSTPKFDVTLPSNGKIIKFRPFLVKEQKLVLQAIEMQDANQLNNALDDILKSCTFNEVDIDSLPVYDVEYLIMQIRARSVGDIVEINYVCKNQIQDKLLNEEQIKFDSEAKEIRGPGECGTRIPLKVNIGTLEVSSAGVRPDNRIMFMDNIGVVMRDLNYGAYKKLANIQNVDTGIQIIAACVEMVIDGDAIHTRSDFQEQELIDWIEVLVGEDLEKLDNFITSMPTMRMEFDLVCPNCNAKEHTKLEGLDDFLV